MQNEKEIKFLKYRRDVLPEQLDRARRRYQGLVREAKRLGLNWTLTNEELFSDD